jgi:hypothetical protein
LDLGTQRCFLNCRHHDVGRQRQVRRFDLEVLKIGLGLQRLDGALILSPDVERIGDGELARHQIERVRWRNAGWYRRYRRRLLLTARIEIALDQRKEFTLLCIDVFVGRAQGRHRGLQVGIGIQCAADEPGERARAIEPPPLARHIATFEETLRGTISDWRRRSRGPQWLGRIALGLWCCRRGKVRSYAATGKRHCSRHRGDDRHLLDAHTPHQPGPPAGSLTCHGLR